MRRWYFNDEGQAADELIKSLADRQVFVPAHWQAGLLETVYEVVLAGQLARGRIDIKYDGLRFRAAFRIDILVEGTLLIEMKSLERLHAAHAKQLLTYLRLTDQPVGLLINFGGATLKEGFRRLVNGHGLSAPPRLCAN